MRPVIFGLVAALASACVQHEPMRAPNGEFFFSVDGDLQSPRLAGRDVVAVGEIVYVVTARQLRFVAPEGDGFSQPRITELFPDGPADGYALVAGDGVLYVGDRFGVTVFDIADPRAPSRIGTTEVPSGIVRLARRGALLVGVTHARELVVLDLSTAAAPTLRGTLALDGGEGPIRALELGGEGRVIIGARGALWFVDVGRPEAPALVARPPLPSFVGEFASNGALLYTGNDGPLSVLDIADPQAPLPVGPADAPWRVGGAAPVVDGDRLYMAHEESGDVYVLSLAAPTRPSLLRVLASDSDTLPNGFVNDMIVANGQVWQTHVGGMFSWVIDF